jgi:N utilization substance protein A
MLGRAIVLVQEDQLSLAIGRRGQNVRLASKLCGWDIEIMTREELDEQIEQAVMGFSSLEGVEAELAEKLVGEGFLSYDDLSIIEPDSLMEMGGLSQEVVDRIVEQAEAKAAEAEAAAAEQRRKQREADRMAAAENVDEGTPDYLADADKSNDKPAEVSSKSDTPKSDATSAGDENNV